MFCVLPKGSKFKETSFVEWAPVASSAPLPPSAVSSSEELWWYGMMIEKQWFAPEQGRRALCVPEALLSEVIMSRMIVLKQSLSPQIAIRENESRWLKAKKCDNASDDQCAIFRL